MLLLKKLLNWFGNATAANTEVKKTQTGLNEEILESMEAFANRPIHKNLTAEIIDATSDDELLQLVFDSLSENLPRDYREEFDAVGSLNRSRQAIYHIWVLEAEVNNGGFNQFYCNSSGQFYELLPDSLQLVGARQFSELTRAANRCYETEYENITKHQDGTLEGFSKSYEDNPLEDFDDQFFALYQKEDLQTIQVDYIRNHKEEFVG